MRNKTAIIRQIIDNPDGGTVVAGAGIKATSEYGGYYVGGNGKPFIADSVESMHQGQLREWLDAQSADYIGWWTDSADGKLYVDGTDWFPTREAAAKASFDRHEIAFWGIAEEREFRFEYV